MSIITAELKIKVITKLPNSEQSYKGKVKTHNYINRQNQSTTGKPQRRSIIQMLTCLTPLSTLFKYYIAVVSFMDYRNRKSIFKTLLILELMT